MKKILILISTLLFSSVVNAEKIYGLISMSEDIKSINNAKIELYYSNDTNKKNKVELDNNLNFNIDANKIKNQNKKVYFNSFIVIGDKKIPYLSRVYFNEDLIEVNYHYHAIDILWGHTSLYFKMAKNNKEKMSLLKKLKIATSKFGDYIEKQTNEDAFFISKIEDMRYKDSDFLDKYYETLQKIEEKFRVLLN